MGICKCEKVTEAEVVEAIRRSLPIDSTQAIRKRTRAGMGHCQGDPENYGCEARVAQIFSRETGLPLNQVGKRPWPASSMLRTRFIEIPTAIISGTSATFLKRTNSTGRQSEVLVCTFSIHILPKFYVK